MMMTSLAIIVLALIVAVVLGLIITQGARTRRLSVVLDKSSRLLDARKARRPPSTELAAGIRDMLEAGQRDEAIEIYRKFTGVDQYTAQDAVDHIARQMTLSEAEDQGDGYDLEEDNEEARHSNGH